MAAILKPPITPSGVLAKKFRGRKVFVVPGPETDVSLLDLLTHYPFLFLSPHPWFKDSQCLFARHDVVRAHVPIIVTQHARHFGLSLCEQQLHTNQRWRLPNVAEVAWILCQLKLAGIPLLQEREVRTSSVTPVRRPMAWLLKHCDTNKHIASVEHVCVGDYCGYIAIHGRNNEMRHKRLGTIVVPT